jgi:lysophospholipase L1-like esterase
MRTLDQLRRTSAIAFWASALVLAQIALVQIASAQSGPHWVATWAASQQVPRVAPTPANTFNNQTVRMIVHTSIGGNRIRIQLSNAYGTTPLVIGVAHIALRSEDSAIFPNSGRALLFNGKPSVAIPPGAAMLSDTADLDVPKLSDLAVSVYLPRETIPATVHATALHTTYISKEGDFTAQPAIADATTTQSWYWLSSVDVLASPNAAAIVTFGDSITDGTTSTPNADRSWPSFLSQRLLANTATANFAVVNEGIAGNRVLADGAGVNALARFDRDVLAIAGVKWVTIMEGINDIGQGTRQGTPAGAISSDAVIAGLRQLIERAHTHGIKVIGCTLTPYEGAAYYSETGEVMREAVNNFIRTSGAYDAIVDFDKVERDPANPKQLLPAFNLTDHLHPNDAGYKAMADAIDLSLFGGPVRSASLASPQF